MADAIAAFKASAAEMLETFFTEAGDPANNRISIISFGTQVKSVRGFVVAH